MPLHVVKVFVTPHRGILDPQGRTIESSLKSLGFKSVANVKVGKYITLEIDAPSAAAARNQARKMCEQLLANPVIEDFTFEVELKPNVSGSPQPRIKVGREVEGE